MDYFFVSVTGFSLGVAARSLLSFGWPALGFIFLLALVAFSAWYFMRERWLGTLALVLLFFTLGAGRVLIAPHAIPPTFAPLLSTKVSLEGVIVADPDIRELNQHLTIEVATSSARTTILAFAPLYPAFEYGEKVKVSGTLEAPAPFDADGGRVFRYDQYLEKDGIFAIITRAYVEDVAQPSGFLTRFVGMLYRIKHTFVEGLENALPEPSAALAEGLLAGGKQGLGKSVLDAFTVSGLVQIVVLSGYNVMIVAEAVMSAFAFFPKRFGLSFAGLAIIGFIAAAGSGSSAIRAGVMACLALFALSTNRSYDALRGLFLALLVMLLWNPFYLAFDPGFELSFIATLGLIVGTPILEPRLNRIKSGLLREAVSTTIAAQVAVLPLLLWHTGNLSFVALPANIVVMPVIPLSMALSFVAGLVGIILPSLAPMFGIPAYLLLSYVIVIGEYSAKLPLAHAVLPAFPFALVIATYAALWYLVRRLTPLRRIASRSSSN